MKFEQPRRPGEDAARNQAQQWRWLYQHIEKLNLVMDELERGQELTPDGAAQTPVGLLRQELEAGAQQLQSLQGEMQTTQTALEGANGEIQNLQDDMEATNKSIESLNGRVAELRMALKDALGGMRIETGTTFIQFGYGVTYHEVKSKFTVGFTQPPAVLVSQVFNDNTLVVLTDKITENEFIAGLNGSFTTSGSRAFRWVAIGK